MADNPLDPVHLFEHVQDGPYFEVPEFIAAGGKLYIPQPFKLDAPLIEAAGRYGPVDVLAVDLQLTRFMILQVVAAVIVAVVFIRLAAKMRGDDKPKGRFWNLFEAMLLFLRDNVARPAIGKHDADRFMPFLWTLFFFVLTCNLLGMVPWAGSPTGALATTATLALITFGVVLGAGMFKMGPIGFFVNQVPHMDLPIVLAIFLKPMLFVIEFFGLCIKHAVLAIRLLATMTAGHLVLGVLLGFIQLAAAAGLVLFLAVTPASLLGATAFSLLELFVAVLQAFIFTFLSALFIGMAVHPH